MPYLNILKDCGTSNSGSCEFKVKTLKGDDNTSYYFYLPRFILSDGTVVMIKTQDYDNGVRQAFSYIFVDINGSANPNTLGKDIFAFIYFIYNGYNPTSSGSFTGYPTGRPRNFYLENSQFGCNKNITGMWANYACASLIMHDNWQIKSDYPW